MLRLSVMRSRSVIALIIAIMSAQVAFAERQGRRDRGLGSFHLLARATYASTSGVYTLEVDPHDPMGLGRYGAAYRFSAQGERIWTQDRPYTLREIVVTDIGTVVGCAYRSELEVTGKRLDPREYFHIVIIDRKGREVLNDEAVRPLLPFASSPPVPRRPYAEQLIVDSDNNRVVVRIIEPNGILGRNVWAIYSLSTGRQLQRFDPRVWMPQSFEAAWVSDAQPVLGTALMLVHFVLPNEGVDAGAQGARFTLIDLDGKPVWTLDLPNDYTALYAAEAERNLARYLREHPATLPTQLAAQFEIRSFAKNKRIAFSVEESAGQWVVTEVRTAEYTEPPE